MLVGVSVCKAVLVGVILGVGDNVLVGVCVCVGLLFGVGGLVFAGVLEGV